MLPNCELHGAKGAQGLHLPLELAATDDLEVLRHVDDVELVAGAD